MIDISLRLKLAKHTEPVLPPVTRLLFRLPHDEERDANGDYTGRRDGTIRGSSDYIIPEPFRAQPDQTIPVKNYSRLLDLLCELNPTFTRDRAMDLLGTGLCWCNGSWGVFSAAIITGGAVLEAERVEGGKVYFKSILISDPTPTKDYVLANHLSAIATSVNGSEVNILTRPDGRGFQTRSPVRMFIIRKTIEPLWMYERQLHQLPPGFEPDSPVWMPS